MHLLHGLKVRRGPEIFHIFYVDDCLLVALATLRDVISLLAILNTYTSCSSQSINITKSHFMFTPGTECEVRHQIKELLHILEQRRN